LQIIQKEPNLIHCYLDTGINKCNWDIVCAGATIFTTWDLTFCKITHGLRAAILSFTSKFLAWKKTWLFSLVPGNHFNVYIFWTSKAWVIKGQKLCKCLFFQLDFTFSKSVDSVNFFFRIPSRPRSRFNKLWVLAKIPARWWKGLYAHRS
jgi:hypothetical protein